MYMYIHSLIMLIAPFVPTCMFYAGNEKDDVWKGGGGNRPRCDQEEKR